MYFSGISDDIKSTDFKHVILNQNAANIVSWNEVNETFIPDSSCKFLYFSILCGYKIYINNKMIDINKYFKISFILN